MNFKIGPTPDAIDPLTGKHTGEHDLFTITDAGLFGDWYGTFASKQEAVAWLRTIYGPPGYRTCTTTSKRPWVS